MEIKTITCSGTNEHTEIVGLAVLLTKFPIAEAGIQVSGRKCSFSTPRYMWVKRLASFLNNNKLDVNLALHVNEDWVENFCCGKIAPELEEILNLSDFRGNKLIKRIQLNFKIGREKTPDIEVLIGILQKFSEQRFILSYNDSNASLIKQIYDRGVVFDNLYDASFGAGVMSETREGVAFEDCLQGYAGGLSPENIASELDKISAKVLPGTKIYIDAQGKLEDEKQHLSLEKCQDFIVNAMNWQSKNS